MLVPQLRCECLCNARYLVVDLMSGGDLRFHISRKTFTEEAVRFWIAELGCALRYIHGQGIIHRDVKPDNVLLDADGHVHLTDFVGKTRSMRRYPCMLTEFCRTWHQISFPGKFSRVNLAHSRTLPPRFMQDMATTDGPTGGRSECSFTNVSTTRLVIPRSTCSNLPTGYTAARAKH
jgi:serine/threonine protein kinase